MGMDGSDQGEDGGDNNSGNSRDSSEDVAMEVVGMTVNKMITIMGWKHRRYCNGSVGSGLVRTQNRQSG